jgi:hypothetical protein
MNNNDKHLTWLTHILESYQDSKETHIGNLKDPYLRSYSDTYKIKCEQHKIDALQFAIQSIKDKETNE